LGDVVNGLKWAVDSPKIRVISVSILSAITWFLWAYWANREDPGQALTSGLFQGTTNFITTLFGTAMLELLYGRMGHMLVGRVMCVVIVSSISLSLMISAHVLANTPNMFLTIFPVYVVVVLFCSSYIAGLHKLQKQQDVQKDVAVS